MTTHDPDGPDDLDLRRLLADAVADVEPHDRLGEIRRRTARAPRRSRRRWTLAVLGAGVATASVVGGVAWLGGLGLPTEEDPASGDRGRTVVAAYFIGVGPPLGGLYREFQTVPDDGTPVPLAALRLLERDAGPQDPDYTTEWPDGSFTGVEVSDGRITVDLTAPPVGIEYEHYGQAVFTVQAAVGELFPVRFVGPDGELLGNIGRDTAALAPVNISDPAEGHTVEDLLTVRGVVSPWGTAPEKVAWELRTTDGSDDVVASGAAPVADRAWEQTTSIADVPPGTYQLVVSVPVDKDGDPLGTDTRTVTVR